MARYRVGILAEPMKALLVVLVSVLVLAGCEVNRPVDVEVIDRDTTIVILPPPEQPPETVTVVLNDTTILTFVRDSVSHELDDLVIRDDNPKTVLLGEFELLDYEPAFGLWVYLDLTLSGNSQRDEVFGLQTSDGVKLPQRSCPVVADDPVLGSDRRLVDILLESVARTSIELTMYHGILEQCYLPVSEFETPNSVHVTRINLVGYVLADEQP